VNQVWDYQTKSCVQTLEGHTHNVSAVCFHPELPIIITGSEDGTVRIWHATTYRYYNIKQFFFVGHIIVNASCMPWLNHLHFGFILVHFFTITNFFYCPSICNPNFLMSVFSCRLENTLNYGLERVWAIGYIKSSRRWVISFWLPSLINKLMLVRTVIRELMFPLIW